MGLFTKFFAQTKKPEGFLGKLMVNGMNGGHAKLADWGMLHLTGITAINIAELGCGGGRNAVELLKRYPEARLSALDYSALSVEKSKEYNKKMIAAGRCIVQQGDVSALSVQKTREYNRESVETGRCAVVQGNVAALPFAAETFDLATAFETVYFWPGLEKCFAEVFRVMKPGGTFLICNESDGTDEASLKYEKIIDGMKCYTAGELTAALQAAGFSEIKTAHHPDKPWIAVLARK